VALEDVSIKVEAGTFHALLGENVARKSTLVKCIMGFTRRTKARCCSRREGDPQSGRCTRDGIGMVYQHLHAGALADRRRKTSSSAAPMRLP